MKRNLLRGAFNFSIFISHQILRNLRGLFTSLRSSLRSKSDSPQGELEHHLKAILGVRRWRLLVNSAVPRGEFVQAAAAILLVPEAALLEVLCRKLDVQVSHPVKNTKLATLSSALVLDDFERAGVMPILFANLVTGVICANPATLPSLGSFYCGSNIMLGSLAEIRQALRLSFAVSPKHESLAELSNAKLGNLVLRQILDESLNYQVLRIEIRLAVEPLEYVFYLAHEKVLRGEIQNRAGESLGHCLSKIVSDDKGLLRIENPADFQPIEFDVSVNALCYEFSRRGNSLSANTFISAAVPQKTRTPSRSALIVEDSDTFSRVVEKFLSKEGIAVERISNGAKAIEYLNATKDLPGVIISDVNMPEMNGKNFLAELKSTPKYRDIRTVMLTSNEELEIELSLVRGGADAFVSKNRHPDILKAHVIRFLDERRLAA